MIAALIKDGYFVNRHFFSGLVMALLAMLPGTAAAFEYFVVNQQVQVYTKPGSSEPMAKLAAGEVLLEIDKQGGWSKVFFLNDQKQPLKGWMKSQFLTAQGAASGAADSDTTYYSATVNNLRLRKGPGADQPVVGRLQKSQMVKLLTEAGGWSKVKYKDSAGVTGQAWTASRYLKPMSSASQTTVAQPKASVIKNAQVTASDVNFRSGPGANYRVLGQLSQPLKVELLESRAEWRKVRAKLNGSVVTGWMVNRFLRPVN